MNNSRLPHNHGQNEEIILEHLPTVEECKMVADIFKQISDGTRLRILWFLYHCEECVSNISAAMEMSDPAVSHHLKVLRNTVTGFAVGSHYVASPDIAGRESYASYVWRGVRHI